ncbi:apolipoprotein N-acyltransferase [Polynucleobacter ibericus]|uniref:apolipoprotein N-acyltransferase n=1 Tax=Polynucleobacter ibericus TaxID=1819725 RepID=UPI00203F09F3|nr:apolipoprotein N-acyltransferase [Polynucleobacter ibericus]
MLDQQPYRYIGGKASIVLSLFILGAVLALIAELPYGGWIQIPVLSLVWWRLNPQTPNPLKKQFLQGLIFGIGYFVIGLWWLYISLHDVGGMNALLACMGVFLLSAYVAVYFSLATLVIPLFKQSRLFGLLLASSWVLAEFLRGYIFTGFPWMGFAETQFNGPFAPIAPFFGGLACTFLAVWASWEIYQVRKHVLASAILLSAVVSISQLAGLLTFTKPVGEPISVRLIQGNFEQSLIFKPEGILQQIAFYHDAITQSKAELIIAPETAFPWPENQLPANLLESLRSFSNSNDANLLFGVIGRESAPQNNREFSNRALGLSPSSPTYIYDKSHLVPFGEFIPPGFHWFVNAFSVPLSDFARGGMSQPNFTILRAHQDPIYAAITICYEDVFGSELASRIRNSRKPTNLLINLTNLAWFGDSQAPTQQLRLSQLRSLETGLPALRATNTGITAVLGPDGKVLKALPEFTQSTLSTQVQAYSGKTPYVIWGNLPILGISCLLLLWGLIRHRRF